jgi:hypothetical protein
MQTDFKSRYPAEVDVSHIIILPVYKDPMEVVFRTVDSIVAQTEAQRIVLVLAWWALVAPSGCFVVALMATCLLVRESRTPDHEGKTKQLRDRCVFRRWIGFFCLNLCAFAATKGNWNRWSSACTPLACLMKLPPKQVWNILIPFVFGLSAITWCLSISIHLILSLSLSLSLLLFPKANANWGLRHAVTQLFQQGATDPVNFMVSTCDADTLFHAKYYEALTADYVHMLKHSPDTVHKTLASLISTFVNEAQIWVCAIAVAGPVVLQLESGSGNLPQCACVRIHRVLFAAVRTPSSRE